MAQVLPSLKYASHFYCNTCGKILVVVVTGMLPSAEFSLKMLRSFRASFRGKRRPAKIHQKSPPSFNAKFPKENPQKFSRERAKQQYFGKILVVVVTGMFPRGLREVCSEAAPDRKGHCLESGEGSRADREARAHSQFRLGRTLRPPKHHCRCKGCNLDNLLESRLPSARKRKTSRSGNRPAAARPLKTGEEQPRNRK